MKKYSAILIATLCLSAGSAWAKLPPPPPLTDEAKVAAEEKKAKAAEAAKKDGEDLGKSQDRVADKYIKEQKAKGVVVKPTPIVAPPATPAVAVTPVVTSPQATAAVSAATPAKK